MSEARAIPAARKQTNRLHGIMLMVLAGLCFTFLDASAKALVASYAALQIVFIRFLVHLLITVALAAPAGLPTLWRTRRPWLGLLRGALLVGSTMFNFVALQYLQLAETVAIFFSAPLIVALVAGPLLGEWIGPRRWAAVLFGFAGVLVITQPGLGEMHWAAIFSLCAATSYAFYALTTRVLASTDGNAVQQFYAALVGTLVLLPLMPFLWIWPQDAVSLGLMVATGVFGFLGHASLISGLRCAPAPVLAPFGYIQIIWMVAAGYLFFGDVPSQWTLVGAVMVTGSGLFLLARERKIKETS